MNNLLLLVLFCTEPVLINKTKYTWNEFDKQTLKRAAMRCGQIFPGYPCVKYFAKTAKKDYRVVCSRQRNK